jgi:hypothetical protein
MNGQSCLPGIGVLFSQCPMSSPLHLSLLREIPMSFSPYWSLLRKRPLRSTQGLSLLRESPVPSPPLPELVEGEPRAPLLRLLLGLFAERLRQAELVLLLQAGAALPEQYFTASNECFKKFEILFLSPSSTYHCR